MPAYHVAMPPRPPTPLLPIQTRVARGLIHADELDEAIEKFKSRRKPPYRIDHMPESDGWFVGKARLMWEPPPHLGVIAGEAVAQYVHALDNLMTAMVRLTGSSARAYWPYAASAAQWQEERMRGLLRPEHYAIVLREQPFNADPTTAFDDWTIRDCVRPMMALANHDKHEAVHVAFVVPSKVRVADESTITGFEWLYEVMEPLETGTVLYRVRYEDPHIQTTAMVFEPDVAFRVPGTLWVGPATIKRYGECLLSLVGQVEALTPEWHLRLGPSKSMPIQSRSAAGEGSN